jgi:hypothetical protein
MHVFALNVVHPCSGWTGDLVPIYKCSFVAYFVRRRGLINSLQLHKCTYIYFGLWPVVSLQHIVMELAWNKRAPENLSPSYF